MVKSEYIYKARLTEFSDGLNVSMRERENDSKDFGFSNWLKWKSHLLRWGQLEEDRV